MEIERSGGGLLRVTIDVPWQPQAVASASGDGASELPSEISPALVSATPQNITVEDCEKVTRQLQFTLEVEGVDYSRLEVSSPGIDRLLRNATDMQRFTGELVDVLLLAPIGAAAQGQVSANRKRFRGILHPGEGEGWQVVWRDEPERKPGQKVSKKRAEAPLQSLGFTLDEVKEVRLAPVVNFKGRSV
ncbi:LSm family protein [Lampropedia hyalina]|uniref:ribosome maturation factor RimP n=1 Tax=Lampropedia hyalina TaxID=198706 RepID=UPI0038994FF7